MCEWEKGETYGSAGIPNEDLSPKAVCNNTAGEEQVVESEGCSPYASNCYVLVSVLDGSMESNMARRAGDWEIKITHGFVVQGRERGRGYLRSNLWTVMPTVDAIVILVDYLD